MDAPASAQTASKRRTAALGATAILALLASLIPAKALANHGAPISIGIYRLPYSDGTSIGLSGDAHSHNTAYDFIVGEDSQVVAAASGWIRAIVDFHGEEPNPGDGMSQSGSTTDGNGDPYDDFLEHACGNQDPALVVGDCGDHNNYVWIEHPNGEWTKYTHLGTGTVTGLGWSVGDWVTSGQVIGLENDIGQATSSGNPGDRAFHLHFETGVPTDPNNPTPFCSIGGFMIFSGSDPACTGFGSRVQTQFCDLAGNDATTGNAPYTANPCTNQAPTADAGGPYSVDEGSTVVFDGTGSSDPDGTPLTYRWCPGTNLDDPCPTTDLDNRSLAQPTYSGLDDVTDDPYTLFVYDQVEAIRDSDTTSVTVNNVAPSVNAVGDSTSEGQAATVSASFFDPGTADTHSATIDWGDGSSEPVSIGALATGIDHNYGDNGSFDVTVTVADDDGGVGQDSVSVIVSNLDPTVSMDTSGQVSFPGGDFFVLDPGEEMALSADGEDPGSDDLTFEWSTGESNTHFNNGVDADPFPSPDGVYPFAASDSVNPVLGDEQATSVSLTLSDDDGGADTQEAGAIVVGTADSTQGAGWWKHQFSGSGSPHIDPATAQAYLDIVNAVSGIFSEDAAAATPEEALALLSPASGDPAASATSELLQGWLQFASGAVSWDAQVTLQDGSTISLLDLMFQAELTIATSTSKSELKAVEQDLSRIRHAG